MDSNINYMPFSCEIVSTENLTPFEKLFRFKRLDDQSFGHKPGQFM